MELEFVHPNGPNGYVGVMSLVKRAPDAGAADSGGGGQEGQPPLLAKSRRGKTVHLPRHLTHSAGWVSYNWVFFNTKND